MPLWVSFLLIINDFYKHGEHKEAQRYLDSAKINIGK